MSQAFVAVWQQAIHLAQGVVEQALAEQREVLIAERERAVAVEDQARQDAAQFRQQAAEAMAARQATGARLADLELLLAQRQTQIEDLQQNLLIYVLADAERMVAAKASQRAARPAHPRNTTDRPPC